METGIVFFFFFQAEDGIRDRTVTGVQTCALPILKAMAMPFTVRDPKILEGLKPSMFVDFTLVVENDRSYAENVRVRDYESVEREPLLARRLQLLSNLD